MKYYTTKDAIKNLGIEQSTISYYRTKGVFTPSIYDSPGIGIPNFYNEEDLIYLFLLRSLADVGVVLQNINQLALRRALEITGQPIIVHTFGCDLLFDPNTIRHKVAQLVGFEPKFIPPHDRTPIELKTGRF